MGAGVQSVFCFAGCHIARLRLQRARPIGAGPQQRDGGDPSGIAVSGRKFHRDAHLCPCRYQVRIGPCRSGDDITRPRRGAEPLGQVVDRDRARRNVGPPSQVPHRGSGPDCAQHAHLAGWVGRPGHRVPGRNGAYRNVKGPGQRPHRRHAAAQPRERPRSHVQGEAADIGQRRATVSQQPVERRQQVARATARPVDLRHARTRVVPRGANPGAPHRRRGADGGAQARRVRQAEDLPRE